MQKRKIAILALLLAGLMVLTSCSFDIGGIVQDISNQGDPGGDAGDSTDNGQEPGGDTEPEAPGDNGEEPGEDTEPGNQSDQDEPGDSASKGFTLFPAALDMPVGRQINLAASGNSAVSWSSSNSGVATVSPDGQVTAITPGEAFITAAVSGNNSVCRVSVTEEGVALAYPRDPGPIPDDPQGERVPPQGESEEDNTPTEVPEDSEDIPEADECTWTILIDDGFDAELVTPAGFSYMVNVHVGLFAEKEGGTSPRGIYQGTLQVDTAIDEESFIAAMNSLGGEFITNIDSNIIVQTAEVTFNVEAYDLETVAEENAAFKPNNVTVHPLVQPQGMAISSFIPSVVQTIVIEGQEGYGSGVAGGGEETPFIIEISSCGRAKLYLPRLLMMMERNTFHGRLVKSVE